jgi:hypothetical protein
LFRVIKEPQQQNSEFRGLQYPPGLAEQVEADEVAILGFSVIPREILPVLHFSLQVALLRALMLQLPVDSVDGETLQERPECPAMLKDDLAREDSFEDCQKHVLNDVFRPKPPSEARVDAIPDERVQLHLVLSVRLAECPWVTFIKSVRKVVAVGHLSFLLELGCMTVQLSRSVD